MSAFFLFHNRRVRDARKLEQWAATAVTTA